MSVVRKYFNNARMYRGGFAPLDPEDAAQVIHDDPDAPIDAETERSALLKRPGHMAESALHHAEEGLHFFSERPVGSDEEAESIKFGSPESDEEQLYAKSRTLNHGDYAYPNVDVMREQSQKSRRKEDDDIVYRRRKKSITSPSGKTSRRSLKGKGKCQDDKSADVPTAKSAWLAWDTEQGSEEHGKSAVESSQQPSGSDSKSEPKDGSTDETGGAGSKRKETSSPKPKHDPYGAVDLVVEDFKAEERERLLERRRGDPALRAGRNARIFKKQWEDVNGQRQLKLDDAEDPPSKKRFADVEQVAEDAHKQVVEAQHKTNPATPDEATVDPGVETSHPVAKMVEPDSMEDFKRGVLPKRMHSVRREPKWSYDDDHNPWS